LEGGNNPVVLAKGSVKVIAENSLFRDTAGGFRSSGSAEVVVRGCEFEKQKGNVVDTGGSSKVSVANSYIRHSVTPFEVRDSASIECRNVNLIGIVGAKASIAELMGGEIRLIHITATGCEAPAAFNFFSSVGHVIVEDSILWRCAQSLTNMPGQVDISISHSCLDISDASSGEGNISEDPRFVGWGNREEIFVDPTASSEGDGSAAAPFPDLEKAFHAFSLALCEDSPCLGAASDGKAMGADNGTVSCANSAALTIRLAAGYYKGPALPLPAFEVKEIAGEGADLTVIKGSIEFLTKTIKLRDLTVAESERYGLVVREGQDVFAESCTFRNCKLQGILCKQGAKLHLINCSVEENGQGGISAYGQTELILEGCRIRGNLRLGSSPAIDIAQDSFLRMVNCQVVDNGDPTSTYFSGPIIYSSGSAYLERCFFARNSCSVVLYLGSTKGRETELVDCTLVSNHTTPESHLIYFSGGKAYVKKCTICSNCGQKSVLAVWNCELAVSDSIIWDNSGALFEVWQRKEPNFDHCCLQGTEAVSGEGNIFADPLLWGWGEEEVVYVDSSAAPGGTGSAERPFSSLEELFHSYSVALACNSPCIGTAGDGGNIGAENGVAAGERTSMLYEIQLAPGRYESPRILGPFPYKVLRGSGFEETFILGTLAMPARGIRIENCWIGGSSSWGILIRSGEEIEIVNCAISENTNGGVMCLNGSKVHFMNCRFTKNIKPVGHGGSAVEAIRAESIILSDCTVSENYCGGGAGSIYADRVDNLTIERCIFTANYGSALFINRCKLTLSNSIFEGNYARRAGAAIYASMPAGIEVLNCLFAGNRSPKGAVLAIDGGHVQIVNSTLVGNASECGSILHRFSPQARISLVNCIVWENVSYPLIAFSDHTLLDRDPLFVEPGEYDLAKFKEFSIGEESFAIPDFIVRPGDWSLRKDSPAIDGGRLMQLPAEDLAGNPRLCGSRPDLGAYEYCPPPSPFFRRGDVNGNGVWEISDAVTLLMALFGGGKQPDCPDAADANDDGRLDLSDAVRILWFLFQQEDLPEPTLSCGPDPTEDSLPQCNYPLCSEETGEVKEQ